VNWDNIKAIGFDLDGTLYDEFEFIVQVYRPIAEHLALVCGTEIEEVYNRILYRWLEKGSSYNRIFDEVLSDYGVQEECRKSTISDCLSIYRNHVPKLVLPERMRTILNYCFKKYEMFVVTDGSLCLQKNKFEALGLESWFQDKNVLISGRYGSSFQKPSINILQELELVDRIKPDKIIFFGDREIDEKFANNAGFNFVKLKYFAINHRE
jgi:FMN phosphatase YigB (HAD superfamily)